MLDQCLKPIEAKYLTTWAGETSIARVLIQNNSDALFILRNKSQYTFHDKGEIVFVEANSITEIKVKTIDVLEEFILKFAVLTAVTAPNTHPEIELGFKVVSE